MKKFKNVILGGTFDHFHKGHKALLNKAFAMGDRVWIGMTKENLYKNKLLSQTIEEYSQREKSVRNYLDEKDWLKRTKFTPITDVFGPSITEKDIQAVIASNSTLANTKKINIIRRKKGFPEIEIIIIPDILAEDDKLLTSERIRAGDIDREGNLYKKLFSHTLRLPENLRKTLRKPLGKIFKGEGEETKKTAMKLLHYINIMKWVFVVAVGDIIVKSLLDVGFNPNVNIIDFRSRRKSLKDNSIHFRKNFDLSSFFVNKPGTISVEAARAINLALHQATDKHKPPRTVIIQGEEDLLALPAIILAPLNSLVLYGQMDLGVVAVLVTEEKKKEIKTLLSKFD